MVVMTPKELLTKLETLDFDQMKSRTSSIIAAHIGDLDGKDTLEPSEAKQVFDQLFDDIKQTGIVPDMEDREWNDHMRLHGDQERQSKMLSEVVVDGDSVEIPPYNIMRQKEMYLKGTTAVWRTNPHYVDYVLCHIKGYRKYYLGQSGMPIYIRGRDIIITGVTLATPNIIEMMKEFIQEHLEN